MNDLMAFFCHAAGGHWVLGNCLSQADFEHMWMAILVVVLFLAWALLPKE